MDGKVVQLDFSAAFNRVSHRGLLCKPKSIVLEDNHCS